MILCRPTGSRFSMFERLIEYVQGTHMDQAEVDESLHEWITGWNSYYSTPWETSVRHCTMEKLASKPRLPASLLSSLLQNNHVPIAERLNSSRTNVKLIDKGPTSIYRTATLANANHHSFSALLLGRISIFHSTFQLTINGSMDQ